MSFTELAGSWPGLGRGADRPRPERRDPDPRLPARDAGAPAGQAVPHAPLPRARRRSTSRSGVVVGLPLTGEGTEEDERGVGPGAGRRRSPARTGLPVELWDERMSTARALGRHSGAGRHDPRPEGGRGRARGGGAAPALSRRSAGGERGVGPVSDGGRGTLVGCLARGLLLARGAAGTNAVRRARHCPPGCHLRRGDRHSRRPRRDRQPALVQAAGAGSARRPSVQAGVYEFPPGTSPWKVLDVLASGSEVAPVHRAARGSPFPRWRRSRSERLGLPHRLGHRRRPGQRGRDARSWDFRCKSFEGFLRPETYSLPHGHRARSWSGSWPRASSPAWKPDWDADSTPSADPSSSW